MTTTVDIRVKDLAIVHSILKAVLPSDAIVYVFGSRVLGTMKRSSDLDLAIDLSRPMQTAEVAALAEAFDESNLPYRVDIVDLCNVSSTFKSIIDRDKVQLK